MREIKFRAWDSEVERFIFSDQTYDDAWFEFKDGTLKAFALHGMDAGNIDEPPQPICDELEDPQQYADKKDRNGKEICEGDVVRVLRQDSFPPYIAEVYYAGGAFCTYCDYKAIKKAEPIFGWPVEVISNIYENHELLEPKGE